jgi:hypothetical protein
MFQLEPWCLRDGFSECGSDTATGKEGGDIFIMKDDFSADAVVRDLALGDQLIQLRHADFDSLSRLRNCHAKPLDEGFPSDRQMPEEVDPVEC